MLGKEVIYEDSIKTTVTGVVADFKENTDFTFHDFISYATMKSDKDLKGQLTGWGGTTSSSQFFVKLLPATKISSVEKQMDDLLKKEQPA